MDDLKFSTEWMSKVLAEAHAKWRETTIKQLEEQDKKLHKETIKRLKDEIKLLKKVK